MAYCEQLGWYLQVPPGVRRPRSSATREPLQFRGTSCSNLPEHVGDLGDEPLASTCFGGLGEAWAGGQNVVVTRRHRVEDVPPRFSEKPLDAVPNDGGTDRARNRETQTRRARRVFVTWEPVQDEVSGRGRLTTFDRRFRSPVNEKAGWALHGRAPQAGGACGPLARRRFRIARPPRDAIRARNPCLRLRRRTFG